MNLSTQVEKPARSAPFARARAFLRRTPGARLGMGLVAVTALAAGAALNWRWLTAIGVAPLLIALAPCAAMCALGVCMSRMGGKSCSSSREAATKGESQLPAEGNQ